ncbi:Anaerobic glycerol-3-phosphate dehydrogenase subunit C [Neomoorella glycerini]|uniref:Glycolate oxidase iron-sulfur subunit n=1 Tax=Neomoorella glycerini TaxID=55779 RepID=A0A6I5ZPB8_9FIRM|nr:(Fe-S)-binding protein [Moorella glycerini]QGP91616.1 Anaerobic glycerol-3-phosphate dehydrogenase subunit C [Moorella glycerini]
MNPFDDLALVEEEMAKCMKCGNCQAVCPLYKETLREAAVARGKVQLAYAYLKGELPATHSLAGKLLFCLTCMACVANCPSGVRVDMVVLAARAAMVREKGLPWVKKVIFQGLKRPWLFDTALKTGRRFQSLALRYRPEIQRCNPRFPIGLELRRVLPPLARKTLREEFPEVMQPVKARARAAFFTGCLENYIYTDTGRAVVNVLLANDVEVIIPRDQHCCGIPTLVHGDVPTAREMAASNLQIFQRYNFDYLVVACATCGEAWKHFYPQLLEHSPQGAAARVMAARARDINELLVQLDYRRPAAGLPLKVTYHDPCHLVRGQGISKEPRQILRSIPGLEFREMKNADRCCGNAGSFSLTNYDMSMQVQAHKVAAIKATGVDTVVTSCPACRMQLEDGLAQAGLSPRVLHVVQVLEQAYEKTGVGSRMSEVG